MEESFRVPNESEFHETESWLLHHSMKKIFILALALRLHFSVHASGRKHTESNQEIVHKAC